MCGSDLSVGLEVGWVEEHVVVLVDGIVEDVVDTTAVAVEGIGRIGPVSKQTRVHCVKM